MEFHLLILIAPLCLATMDLVIPAYFYPEKKGLTYWNQLATTAAQVPMTIILNPNSGPDTAVDPDYVTVSNNARNAGAKMIGYVYSLYGARPFADVALDIDRYLSFYTVDGFFIDEMSDEANSTIIGYYKSLYNYIKGKSSQLIVMNNPGTRISQSFLTQKVADRFVIFENPQKNYASYTQPAWQANYSPETFVHMIYNANTTQMVSDITFAKSKSIGGVFVSNDKLPNPYDTLPPYWNDEVAAVVAANGNCAFDYGVPYVDVFTGDIVRLSSDMRRFIRNHDVVTLNLDSFSDWAFRYILKQWQYGRTFYDLKRLEVTGRSLSFKFCARQLTDNLIEVKDLGYNDISMTKALLLPSPRRGYCLVITDPLRMIFMPVRSRANAFAALLAEFAPQTPVDVSSILYDPQALNKILKLAKVDDYDFFA